MSTDPDSPDTLADGAAVSTSPAAASTPSTSSPDDHDTVRVPGWMAGALVVLLGLGVGGTGFAIGRSTAREGGSGGVDRPILTSGQVPGGRQGPGGQLPGGGQGGQLPGGRQGPGGQLPGGRQGSGGQLPGGRQGPGGQLPGGGQGGTPNDQDGPGSQDTPDDGDNTSASN